MSKSSVLCITCKHDHPLANQHGIGKSNVLLRDEYQSKLSARRKLWNDRNYAELWEWADTQVLRFRTRTTDPWMYRIGEFTKDHCPYVDRRDRAMTPIEIDYFREAQVQR